jgi:hypothetical protein
MEKHITFKSLNFVFNKANYAVIIYFLIRTFSWLFLIGLAPDIGNQINMAINLSDGRGFVLNQFDFNTNCNIYSEYFSHPPFFSIVFIIYNHLIGNLIWSLFAIAVTLALFEAILLKNILQKMFISGRKLFYLMVIMALYIGHLDRGLISDYLALVWAIWFIHSTCLLININDNKNKHWIYIQFAISIILMPLVKYSLIPIACLPVCLIFYYIIFKRHNLVQKHFTVYFVILSFFVSIGLFLYLTHLGHGTEKVKYLKFVVYDLFKLDYFWLHFGMELDRLYKHIYWNLPKSMELHFWNIGQLLTVCVWLFVWFISKKRGQKFVNSNEKLTFYLFVLSMFLQIFFLFSLTVTNVPQGPVKYGIDNLVWVYIEEARYYNYLSFFAFLFFAIKIYDLRIKVYKCVLFLIVLSGFYLTYNAKTSNGNHMPIINLLNDNDKVTSIIKSLDSNLINNCKVESRNKRHLMNIYGFK